MKDKWRIHQAKDKRSSKKNEILHNQGKRNEIPLMRKKSVRKVEEPKIHYAKRNTRFIQKRVYQKRKRFIKYGNVQAHQGKKDVQRVHQNDLR